MLPHKTQPDQTELVITHNVQLQMSIDTLELQLVLDLAQKGMSKLCSNPSGVTYY